MICLSLFHGGQLWRVCRCLLKSRDVGQMDQDKSPRMRGHLQLVWRGEDGISKCCTSVCRATWETDWPYARHRWQTSRVNGRREASQLCLPRLARLLWPDSTWKTVSALRTSKQHAARSNENAWRHENLSLPAPERSPRGISLKVSPWIFFCLLVLSITSTHVSSVSRNFNTRNKEINVALQSAWNPQTCPFINASTS